MPKVLRIFFKILPGVLVLLLSLALIYETRVDTPTYDEPANMAAAYAYVYKNDYRLYPDNPPLVKILSGLFLFPIKNRIKFPDNLDTYTNPQKFDPYIFGTKFLYQSNNPTDEIIFLARLPNIAFTLVIAVILYLFSRSLYGQKAALLSLVLYTLDPNIRGHGHILAFDLPLAFIILLILYLTYLFYKNPKHARRYFILIIISFILGIFIKFTFAFFILVYVSGLLFIVHRKINLKSKLFFSFLIITIPLIFLWVFGSSTGYNSKTLDYTSLPIFTSAKVALANDPVWKISQFLPAPYFFKSGIQTMYLHSVVSQPSFLLGQVHAKNDWPYYFLVSFFLKTPLPTQILIYSAVLMLLAKITSGKKTLPGDYLPFLVGILFFLFMSLSSHINNTYRYLFPALVLFMLGTGQVANIINIKKPLHVFTGSIIVICLILTSFSSFPHDLSYTNELTGIPPTGYKYLSDSEIDWGQDLGILSNWLKINRLDNKTIILSYLGTADPSYYGIKYRPLRFDGLDKLEGIVAISVGNLTLGDWQTTSTPEYRIGLTKAPLDFLRVKTPFAVIGKSIFVYNFPKI